MERFSAVMTRPNTYIILHAGRHYDSALAGLGRVYSKCARRYKDLGFKPSCGV
jgi:hypothetical protein